MSIGAIRLIAIILVASVLIGNRGAPLLIAAAFGVLYVGLCSFEEWLTRKVTNGQTRRL